MGRLQTRMLFASRIGFVTLCMLTVAGIASAGDKILYEAPAGWVKIVELPKPDPAYSGAPGQILLQNMQVNFSDDGTNTYFTEVALHIQTPAGLQAAQAFVVWNPETDEAAVHKLQIIRGDQVIDVLASGQTFTTLRREQNLDRAMLDGNLTGVLQPEGLRVGDTMVFASSIRRLDPAMGGNNEAVLQGLSANPVVQQSIRATWLGQSVRWRQSDDLHGKVIQSADTRTFTMDRSHVVAKELQGDAPARFNQFGLIEFSQFATWQDLSKLLAPRYDKATVLTPNSPLMKEAATIRAASNDPKVRAAMALQLVENQVRYVFLGVNLGGYTPADADSTWQRRFGDCKGKTALLIALLKVLDIKAEPALVSTDGGDGLDQRLPSFELFDHVVVRAEIEGNIYWMDGTRLGDTKLDSLPVPALRWALPISDAGATLEALPTKPLAQPTSDTFLRLDASAGLDVTALAHAEAVFRGDTAVQFNMALMSIPAGDRDKGLRAYWNGQYDWIEPRKVSAVFDQATGEERLTMDGAAKMEWKESEDGKTWRYQTDIMNIGWSYSAKREAGQKRDIPIVINFPYFQRTREEIVLPKRGDGFTTEGGDVDRTDGGSEFRRTIAMKDGTLFLESSKRALVSEISYADAMEVDKALTDLWAKEVILVAPRRYHKDTATKPNPETTANASPADSVDDLLAQGKNFASQNKIDEALVAYNKVLRLDDHNVAALQGRATILGMRGNFAAAAADYELALKLDPTQWITLNGLGAARLSQARYDEAIAAFTAALDLYPNDVMALIFRARAHVAQKKFDLARQDAKSAKDLYGEQAEILVLEADIEVADKRVDVARDIIRQGLLKNPEDFDLHEKMASLLENCTALDADQCAESKKGAVDEYDAIIALKPSAWAFSMRAQDRPKADRKKRLEDIDAGIKADPKSTLPLLVRAAILINEDKAYDQALTDLDAAVKLNPKDSQPYSIRSGVYFKLGKPELALADLEAVKRINPQQPWAFNASCWSRATHNTELDKALVDCDMAVKMAPQAPAYLDSRAFVKMRLGQLDEALTDYNSVLALQPDMAPSLYGRGLVKLRMGDKAGGNSDIAAARKKVAKIDEQFTEYGLKP
ncbi:Beta-barrel assembly-enhancing protease (plasmid) [Asticcacaulis sp. MM231]|uniref:tetratricopeptide repeat protein n=1 Tax=Asticcacaulis sp. MM231 TaxID=3157666 RepID=UPI0032D5862B